VAVLRGGRARHGAVALVALAAAVCALVAAPAGAAAATTRTYVVELVAPPLASYTGGRAGIPGTSPRRPGQLQPRSRTARRYRSYLAQRQRTALRRVPGAAGRVRYSYRTAFSGFAVRLTAAEARRMGDAPGVRQLWRDARLAPAAITPAEADTLLGGVTGDGAGYLGLPQGLWQRVGGVDAAGEGIVVGVLDTGITPEHPSFADAPAEGYLGEPFGPPPADWRGTCQAGQRERDRFTAADCSGKLIGARWFANGIGAASLDPEAFLSPRDDDGHGTHTASTAAGNFGVDPAIDGNDLAVDRISGIAPRARVAAYKVCWPTSGGSSCAQSDIVAAIDAAVADGVDVINESLSSRNATPFTADGRALLGAAAAGVFVAAAAGNDGPAEQTLGSPGDDPWVTSVAATSMRRELRATAEIAGGPGESFAVTGASVTPALPAAPLVDAAAVARPGVPAATAQRCQANALDAAQIAGKVVLCIRGGNGRTDKSRVVAAAGGAGMILYNDQAAQELPADLHFIPTVAVSRDDGLRIKAAIGPGTTAALGTGGAAALERGGVLASFSARGPQAAVPDVGKPDVSAPGVGILAGAAPDSAPVLGHREGQLFQPMSGTSMAAPHVAGVAALLRQLHPAWSPAAVRSALVTTARPDVLAPDGTTRATPLQAGAGEVDAQAAADPSLVVDARAADYVGYLKAVAPQYVPGDVTPIRPADLNLPQITLSRLAGTETTARTFTSVDTVARHWTVAIDGLEGIEVTPSVSAFDVEPGGRATVGLTFRATGAPLDAWATGALVLASEGRTVRVPISARPRVLEAPQTVAFDTELAEGSRPLAVQAGFAGALSAASAGLAAPATDAGRTIPTARTGQPVLDGSDPGTQLVALEVGEGAELLAAGTRNAAGDTTSDLDLYLFRDPDGDGDLADAEPVEASASAGARPELVVTRRPEPGRYVVAIVGWATGEPSTYDLSTWQLGDRARGLRVTGMPEAVELGARPALELAWSGVGEPGMYLGLVSYGRDGAALPPSTLVQLTRTAEAVPVSPQ